MKKTGTLQVRTAIILAGVMVLVGLILCVNLVSATLLGNVKSYNEATKTITIRSDFLGLFPTGKVSEITLDTPINNMVLAGKHKQVAEITINNYNDLINFIGSLEFYNIKRGIKRQDREFTWEYKEIIGTKKVIRNIDVCTGGKGVLTCHTETEEVEVEDYEWNVLDTNNLPKGKITIGIFTDVSDGDKVEWIPTFYNQRITEWANFEGYSIVANQSKFSDYDSSWCIAGVSQIGQTFRVLGSQYVLAGAELWIQQYSDANDPGILNVSLYAVDTATKKPTGTALSSGSATAVEIPDAQSSVNITMGTYILLQNYNYSIVLKAPFGYCPTDYAYYTRSATSDTLYPYGNVIESTNSGTSWDIRLRDLKFAVYGFSGLEQNQNVTLISPANGISLTTIGTIFRINANITSNPQNYTWRNVTYSVWKAGVLFNETQFLLPEPYLNSTNSSAYLTNFGIGNYKWNVKAEYANHTYSDYLTAGSNFTFSVGAKLIDINYNLSTVETKTESFISRFNVLAGSSISSAKLVYDGIVYPITSISLSGTNLTLARTLDIPLSETPFAAEEKSFYFNFTFTGGYNQTTSLNYQNVSTFNLVECNSTYRMVALNFTLKNETVPLKRITPFAFSGSFYFWFGGGGITKNYSIQNLTVNNEMLICINPNSTTLQTNADVDYSATGFSQRSYYLRNATVTNSTNKITLFSLEAGLSTSVIINLKDARLTPLENHFLKMMKYYPGLGAYYLVEIAKSDEFGNTLVKAQEEDTDYRFIVEDNGGNLIYTSNPMRVICTATPCKLEFITGVTEHMVQQLIDFQNVAYTLTWNETTKYVLFTFSDSSGLTQSMNLQVIKITGYGEVEICNNDITGSAGISSCLIGNQTGQFIAKVYRTASPTSPFAFLNIFRNTNWEEFGVEGLIWGLLFIITMFFTGLVIGIAIAAIMTLVGVVFLMATGIVYMPWVVVASIAATVIILIVKMKS